MRSRLNLAPVFTRKLAPMPLQFANPVWVVDDAVDLDYHVQPRHAAQTGHARTVRRLRRRVCTPS